MSAAATGSARRLRRRLEPHQIHEIVRKYADGATTPVLCREYSLSKGGLLKLLRDEGVHLRNQPLCAEQFDQAAAMYAEGRSLTSIANHFDVSYNGVRQAFVRAGTPRRPRGGSHRQHPQTT